MKKMKKILALALAFVLAVTILPMVGKEEAKAEEKIAGYYRWYVINKSGRQSAWDEIGKPAVRGLPNPISGGVSYNSPSDYVDSNHNALKYLSVPALGAEGESVKSYNNYNLYNLNRSVSFVAPCNGTVIIYCAPNKNSNLKEGEEVTVSVNDEEFPKKMVIPEVWVDESSGTNKYVWSADTYQYSWTVTKDTEYTIAASARSSIIQLNFIPSVLSEEEAAKQPETWTPKNYKIVDETNPQSFTIKDVLTVDPLYAEKGWINNNGEYIRANEDIPKGLNGTRIFNGENIYVPASGSVLKINTTEKGKVDATIMRVRSKEAYVVRFPAGTEAGSSGGNIIDQKAETANTTTNLKLNFTVEPGYDYYMFVDGSKGQFGAITYTPENKVEDTTPSITLTSGSLTLDGTIGINFYFKVSNVDDMSAAKAVLTSEDDERIVSLADAKDAGNGEYRVTYKLAAKQANQEVVIKFTDNDGNSITTYNSEGAEITGGYTYSVSKYNETLKDESPTKELVKAVQNYGDLAKDYFSGTTTATAPEVTASEVASYEPTKSGEGITYIGSSLVIKSDTSIKHYFNESVADYEVTCESKLPEGVTLEKVDNYVAIRNIPAKNLADTYTITLTKDEKSYTINYSALSYVQVVLNKYQGTETKVALQNVVKGIYKYYKAAAAYFAV